MASQPPVINETPGTAEATEAAPREVRTKAPRPPRTPIRQILRELDWVALLVVGIGMGVTWTLLLAQGGLSQILAGLLPVLGGILIGRRIKAHVNWHGVMLGIITALAASAIAVGLILAQGPRQETLTALLFALVTLLPFPAFGVITAHRSEQRSRDVRAESERRGGSLDRPGRVRTLGDLQALSLPQLGGYVADLFRKHGFVVNDYRIEKDKDRIDFQMTHENQPWLIRVTTVDKVKPGAAQELAQRLKAEDFKKGVVITSMEFQEAAIRWAKDKPVALIDGSTLLSMDD